ncbi:MAG: low specificity L-threonine aldolase [Chlorobi bacterium]|nr:low specificity L-threonine aldolase [Chlorobiota bacterium]
MHKYSFKDDYSEGAHPEILKVLTDTNYTQTIGYGEDEFSEKARKLIKEKINNRNVDIHFATGGTQANLIVISSILKPHHSVIAATTAHIEVHEAGAIEATGHKINTVETKDGKLSPDLVRGVIDYHTDEHMVKPKMVFISNSTETGTIYSKKELTELYEFCKKNKLYLYIDGARLASALTSEKNDLTLNDISELTDIFYIGGTKNGALLGEAIVINNDELKEDFRFYLKQKGALLAKGRVLGVQFLTLFKDNLYFRLAEYANKNAKRIADAFKSKGYRFLSEPATNQLFPILPNELINKLHKKYDFYVWSKIDKKYSAVRIICSWATKEDDVAAFIDEII